MCVCSTENCNDDIVTSAPVPVSTIVTDPVAVTTPLPAQPTAGAQGMADQFVLCLYLLCTTGLSLLY